MSNRPKLFTIYALMHPETLRIYYVGLTGKSVTQRIYKHLEDAGKERKWATGAKPTNKELIDAGLEPIVITLDGVATNDRRYAEDLEFYWINQVWRSGHPIQNSRKLLCDPRDIYVNNIRELHEAVNSGWRYAQYDSLRRCPPLIIENPYAKSDT